ncbi:PREDICTED: uncharacterized protein C8orf48 homolog [Elephantulus edwardii]|uniref:uncharacterized protein C8orf48 homolog n=1 Tax=Elephantulus edwardii TaxID=28737 RepID=UPI0003F0C4F7|nr:PREDICTED: uncharacterized protein C8orf48 homolog [Elephantulus edwardii]
MANFSGETVRSFTDETESSDSFSSSGSRQSWSQDSGSKSESGKLTVSSEYQDKPSELSDSENNEKKLTRKWISHLRGNESNHRNYQPDKHQKEITHITEKELHALQSFCTIKINLIHRRLNYKEAKSSRGKKIQLKLDAEDPELDAHQCTVPDELLNRIYFKNVKATLEWMSTAEQHISSQCHSCNRKRAELAQSAFLKQKKTLLQSFLLQQKIDEHLHTKDFLTYIGEAHKDLPRLSDDPRLIWKRLTGRTEQKM